MLDMVFHCRHHKMNLLKSRSWGYLPMIRLLGKAWVEELEPREHLFSAPTYTSKCVFKNLIICLWFGEHLPTPAG